MFQITRWLLPLWTMAAIFDTENNEYSQDDYIVPVFAVNDDSGVRSEWKFFCMCLKIIHFLVIAWVKLQYIAYYKNMGGYKGILKSITYRLSRYSGPCFPKGLKGLIDWYFFIIGNYIYSNNYYNRQILSLNCCKLHNDLLFVSLPELHFWIPSKGAQFPL